MPTTPSALSKKLGIKKDMRALIVNAPHGYLDLLAPLPDGVAIAHSAKGSYNFVQIFLTRQSEIQKAVSSYLKHSEDGAVVWIAYPKQTSKADTDLNRDILREAAEALGWRTVSIVSIDSVWSALRFRPVSAFA